MTRARLVASVPMGLLFAAAPALAGGGFWVGFVDETATRMNPSIPVNDLLGKDDPEEKDYAWGDVDMDGDIDLVVVRKFPGSNSTGKVNRLFMNEGGVLIDRTSLYATAATDGGNGFDDLTADRDVALIDVDGDGNINILDLIELLGCFGQLATGPCGVGQDVNLDGTINVMDLIDMLLDFGPSCP